MVSGILEQEAGLAVSRQKNCTSCSHLEAMESIDKALSSLADFTDNFQNM